MDLWWWGVVCKNLIMAIRVINFFVFLSFLYFCLLPVLSLARCLRGSWACNCLEAAPIPRWVFEAASLPFLHQLRLQCVFLGQKLFEGSCWSFSKIFFESSHRWVFESARLLAPPSETALGALGSIMCCFGKLLFSNENFSKKCLKILTDEFLRLPGSFTS